MVWRVSRDFGLFDRFSTHNNLAVEQKNFSLPTTDFLVSGHDRVIPLPVVTDGYDEAPPSPLSFKGQRPKPGGTWRVNPLFGPVSTSEARTFDVNCDGVPVQVELHEEGPGFILEEVRVKRVIKDTLPSVVRFEMTDEPEGAGGQAKSWTGSGFVIGADDLNLPGYVPPAGYTLVATNFHVGGKADVFKMRLYDGSEIAGKAKMLVASEELDVAIMLVNTGTRRLKPAAIGEAEDVEMGDSVLVFGNPLGMPFQVTKGIVSNADYEGEDIHIDAPSYPGNSGGPIVDLGSGHVVAMLSYGIRGYDNFNFGIPIWLQLAALREAWGRESRLVS